MFCCCIGNYKGTTNQSTRKQLEFTRHLTPLSPWRGVGGEADCGRGEADCGRVVEALSSISPHIRG